MKLSNKFAMFALAGLAATACTDNYDWTPGGDDTVIAGDSVQSVSFEQNALTLEKDPVEETTVTVRMARKHAATADTVPVEILTNTDSVFTIGKCVFADGESVATLEINYPTAEVGKTYTLELAVTDSRYASAYDSKNTFSLKVTRVKWVTLEGKGHIEEDLLFGTKNPEVEIQMRDDDHTQFRIWHAFHGLLVEATGGALYPFEKFNIFSDEASEYLSFRILKNGEEFRGNTIASDNLVYFNNFNCGYYNSSYGEDHFLLHPSAFNGNLAKQDMWQKNAVLAWQENGLPGKVQLAPYMYLFGVGGGWDHTQDDNQVVIFFPGYKDPVTAKMEEDFDWEEVFTGNFTSNQLAASGSASLYKGTCTLTTDAADSVFRADYGTAYAISDPYAEGYPLYFAVDDDGNILVPEDVTIQPTGIVAMGDSVFATINGNKSSFTDKVITLNITFTNKDGSLEYGTADEVLSNITYTTVGTADWAYIFLGNEDGSAYLDEGLELQQRDDRPGTYQILHALNDVTIQFTINEDNTVTFPQQEIGMDYQPGTPLYVTDIYSLNNTYDPCVYDPETTTINALLFYNIGGGQGFSPMPETIKLNFSEQPARSAKAKKVKTVAAGKKVSTFAQNVRSPWAGYKKVDTRKKNFEPAVLR